MAMLGFDGVLFPAADRVKSRWGGRPVLNRYFKIDPRLAPRMALIMVLAGIGSTGAYLLAEHRTRDAQIQAQIADREIQAAGKSLLAGPNGAPIDVRPKATGVAGENERIIKTFLASLAAEQRAYLAAMRRLGFPDVMSPSYLAHTDLGVVRQRIVQARAVIDAWHSNDLAHVEAASAAYRRLGSDGGALQEFQGSGARRARMDANWARQRDMLAEEDAILVLLEASKGQWSVKDDVFVFSRIGDHRAFDAHVARIGQLQQAQEAQERDVRERAERSLDR
jgi:hypothetical protein